MMNRKTAAKTSSKTRMKKHLRPKVHEHPLSSAVEFTNREIGWLNFNLRVLAEAEDSRTPLLERLRFLSIVNSNLDEFFQKRVGGLKRQLAFGITSKSSDGKAPIELLSEIRSKVLPMVKEQGHVFSKVLKPALRKEGIHLLKWSELSIKDKEFAQKYYLKNVFPVLTPLSVDPGHPFPFISNLSTSLGVILKSPATDEKLFARVKVPQVLPSWIRIETEKPTDHRFVSLVELIKENLHDLFPSMQVLSVMPFRITRNADITRDEEDAEDLLSMIEEELRQRRFAEVVRIEHGPKPDPLILKFLTDELEITDEDVYEVPEEWDLDYRALNIIADLKIPQFRFEKWTPVVPTVFLEGDSSHIFNIIKQGDQLIHSPYESFSATVEKFIQSAAEDPKVLAIKMTMYRTGDNSPFVKSLIRAAESGKQVVCLIELKARFDEERNIYWAQELEAAGVHVVYGVVGLKTHAKTALVVRQEADQTLKSYAHLGTGNYNVGTSRLYTDFGILTCREEITSELIELFNFLTGRSLKSDYQHLLVAPVNMFQRFKFLIEREADHAKHGRPSFIFGKMNSMEENDIAMSLYQASQKGVTIELSVRGFCCLRPGVKGMSENLRVSSVIGRFLEHSRIFYFRNGKENPIEGDFYIGSADWMYRNLHARVECIAPILDTKIKEQIWEVIQLHLRDQRQTWDMQSDGRYIQRKGSEIGLQQQLMTIARGKSLGVESESDGGN
jgi:polyphosphate kinase